MRISLLQKRSNIAQITFNQLRSSHSPLPSNLFPCIRATIRDCNVFIDVFIPSRETPANVLLLRLVDPRYAFPDRLPSPILDMTIYYLNDPVDVRVPALLLRTESAENTYPALPVSTDVDVIVSFVEIPVLAGSRKQYLRLAPTARSRLR